MIVIDQQFILPLEKVGINDIDKVGGKNASLGEMIQHLTEREVRVPGGFVVTVAAYQHFIAYNQLDNKIKAIVADLDPENMASLQSCGHKVRTLVESGNFSEELSQGIEYAYKELSEKNNQVSTDVAVRSSATAEDLPDASFAGQQETYLNVNGCDDLLLTIKKCFASLFTDRAISYRHSFGYDHFLIGLSVCVQKMVRSDLATSGVAFSIDTESGFKDAVIINGSYGLGEMVVQGAVSPDEFIVFKPTLRQGFAPIIEKKMGRKNLQMIYSNVAGERVTIIPVSEEKENQFCISEAHILQLASWVIIIEDYYSNIKNHWCPMDVEWAVDGISNELFIVQARPETIHSRREETTVREYIIEDKGREEKIILKGVAVGDKIAAGNVRLLANLSKEAIQDYVFNQGDILVTDMTDPDWEPIMKKASAIVTNKGGRTCHAAIVARELGVPAIVGTGNATKLLTEGLAITASCAEGEVGIIYSGAIPFHEEVHELSMLPNVKTPILLNVASPDMAFHFAHLQAKGIGLAREEFIINNYIKAHPMALLQHEQLGDVALTETIKQLSRGYANGESFFIEKLAQGIAKIGAAFYPNKVIVRFSDFKSNEYFNLPGGSYFEPHEENPMIGWRGASRYYSKEYKEAFGLECKAIKKVREEMGLENVIVMVPFCRTPAELLKVYDTMKEYGLERGKNGLEVYIMAELPSNVMLAKTFAQHIDGFSIGSNDLTQLTLGLDRDSSLVAHLYDERNEAVKAMISLLIKAAKEANIKVGICGQGPSDFPDFAQFLVEEGIDTISVTPDAYFKTVNAIAAVEATMGISGI